MNNSADTILTNLGVVRSKTIKQIDNLSEQLLDEFQKLAALREAITLEQKHLQELYQIKETVHTLGSRYFLWSCQETDTSFVIRNREDMKFLEKLWNYHLFLFLNLVGNSKVLREIRGEVLLVYSPNVCSIFS